MTSATRWFERTLDDSANRRLSLPEAFLATDAVLELYANIASGMEVYPAMISRWVKENLPFMATEKYTGARFPGRRQAAVDGKAQGRDVRLHLNLHGKNVYPYAP